MEDRILILPVLPPVLLLLVYASLLVACFVLLRRILPLQIKYILNGIIYIMSEENKEKTKTLVLLDAHAIIHRAYHALPEFLSSKGEPTGALYGLSTMIMRIVSDLKPDFIVACYDLPQKTFRHEAYEGYKAG